MGLIDDANAAREGLEGAAKAARDLRRNSAAIPGAPAEGAAAPGQGAQLTQLTGLVTAIGAQLAGALRDRPDDALGLRTRGG